MHNIRSPKQWNEEFAVICNDSRSAVRNAQQLLQESRIEISRSINDAQRRQKDTTQSLAARARVKMAFMNHKLKDIRIILDQLQDAAQRTNCERYQLEASQARLQRALRAIMAANDVTESCLRHRDRRDPQDLVDDDVSNALRQEKEIVGGAMMLIKQSMAIADHHLGQLQAAQSEVEQDWSGKMEAYGLEVRNTAIRNQTGHIRFQPASAALRPSATDVVTWAEASNKVLLDAHERMSASALLRTDIDAMLRDVSRQIGVSSDTVASSLARHLADMERTLLEMEDCHRRVTMHIKRLEGAMGEHVADRRRQDRPMQVAQTRLHERAQRPLAEDCRDESHKRLLDEVDALTSSDRRLGHKMSHMITAMAHLRDVQQRLQSTIFVRKRSIALDREKCTLFRTHFPDTVKLSGL